MKLRTLEARPHEAPSYSLKNIKKFHAYNNMQQASVSCLLYRPEPLKPFLGC